MILHSKPPPEVVVTRPVASQEGLRSRLEGHGFRVRSLPLLSYTSPSDEVPLCAAAGVDDYDVWVFTSAEAARRFLSQRAGRIQTGPPPRVVAVGTATTEALRERGVTSVEQPGASRADGVVDLLRETLPKPSRVLFPRAADARSTVTKGLREAGHQVDDVVAYAKTLPIDASDSFHRLFDGKPYGWVTFTSPRIVGHFVELAGDEWSRRRDSLCAASIGPITSAALMEAGAPRVFEAASPSDESLTRVIVDQWKSCC